MAGEGGKLLKRFSSFPRAPILFSKLFNCDVAIPGALRAISSGALCRTFSLCARRAKCRASAAVRAVKVALRSAAFFVSETGGTAPGRSGRRSLCHAAPCKPPESRRRLLAGRCACRRQRADRRERADAGKGRATTKTGQEKGATTGQSGAAVPGAPFFLRRCHDRATNVS